MGQEGVCSGDSGGPALDLERRVIGVLSRGSDPCGTPVYGAVAGFSDWMTATAIAAADAGGYDPPFWALTGSSDRPPGIEGDPCSSGDDCSDGSICYYESDPLLAVCTRPCGRSAECSEPAICVQGFDAPDGGLCLVPKRPNDEPDTEAKANSGDSCAMTPAHRRSSAPAIAILGLAMLMLARRRATR